MKLRMLLQSIGLLALVLAAGPVLGEDAFAPEFSSLDRVPDGPRDQLMAPSASTEVRGAELVEEPWQPGAERRMQVRPQALTGERMQLELPDGQRIEAFTDDLRSRGPGQAHWHGRFQRADGRAGTGGFTVVGGRMVGQFTGPDGRYQIRPGPDGGHRLRWIDPESLPEHMCPSHMPEHGAMEAHQPLAEVQRDADTTSIAGDQEEEDPEVDVLLLYTDAAVSDLGGGSNSEADARLEILGAMDAANAGFDNSAVSMRVRTVAMHPWDLDEDDSDDLHILRQDADLDALREEYAADLVALIGDYGRQFCGVAFVKNDYDTDFADFAYSLTNSLDGGVCLANQTLAHELGHNMGLHHDPGNAPEPQDLIEPFAYGHFVDDEFRTIMSYWEDCPAGDPEDSCPLIDHFSNPDVEDPGSSGFPTGLPDERDNARVLGKTAPVVEDFFEPEFSLGASLGMPWASWETGGFAIWLGDEDGDGLRAISGEVLGDEAVWFEAPLVAGEYEFDWQMVEFSDGGELKVHIDGEEAESFDVSDADPQEDSVTVAEEDSGATVRWTFRPEAGADFGTERMVLRNLQDRDAEEYLGTVHNAYGQAIEQAAIMVEGDPVAWTDVEGGFELAFNPDAVSTDSLTIGGEGLVDQDIPFEDCQGGEGCEVILEGETRTVSGRLDNLLEGEEVEIRVPEPSGGSNDDALFAENRVADEDGEVTFELELDAAVNHEAAAIEAFGYEDESLALPNSLALREGEGGNVSLALEPRVPALVDAEPFGNHWRGFALGVEIDPNERATELILDYGRAGSGLDQQKTLNLSAAAGVQSRDFEVRGLDCDTEYSWRLEAISDRGDSSATRQGSLETRDCSRVPGCSLAGSGERVDPQLPLLLALAIFGLLRARWARLTP